MPKTKPKPKPVRPPNPRALARAFVDVRLDYLTGDHWDFVDPERGYGLDQETADNDWSRLVVACRATMHPAVTPEQYETLVRLSGGVEDGEDALTATEEAHAQGGFFIGLELGRRLGGAR